MVLKNVSHVGVVLTKHFESGSCIEGAASQEVFDGLILELTFRILGQVLVIVWCILYKW